MQYVNLYLPEYRVKHDWLTLEYSLAGIGLVLAFMLAIQYFSISSKNSVQSQLLALETQRATLEKDVEKLKIKPNPTEQLSLEKRAEALRMEIKNRKAIAEVMSGQTLGNQNGFSKNLQAMSLALVGGISLSGFEFNEGGKYVALKGVTSKPDAVPLYISRLREQSVFAASRFGSLSIHEEKGQTLFSTTGGGQPASNDEQARLLRGALK